MTTRLFFDMLKSTKRGENFGRNKRQNKEIAQTT
nr:MAG TPA: hypothetical protein [Caudoviricetes sp.]